MALNSFTNDTFSTNNTALAAWLVSQGFELLDLDFSNPDSVAFLFRDDTQALHKAIRLFELEEAEGNINAFFRSYKRMLLKIRGGRL